MKQAVRLLLVAIATNCGSAFVPVFLSTTTTTTTTTSASSSCLISTSTSILHQPRQSILLLSRNKQGSFPLHHSYLGVDKDGQEEGPSAVAAAAVLTATAVATTSPAQQRRRVFIWQAAVAALVTVGTMLTPTESAQATYSAYSHREDDWKQRQSDGAVQFSSAASLRSQLREIAPMNASERRLFCPNGTTAAVSPLMENKCGDRLAMPSVYGRTEDAMGNSIPGFAGGFYSAGMSSSSAISSSSADTGGLPSYSKYTGK